jgi:adenine phosphoribosyltransferase
LDWLQALKDDLKGARVVRVEAYGQAYNYIVNPLSSGVPEIRPEILWGCAYEVARAADLRGVQKILAPEAMAIHIAAPLSMITGIPMLVVRKRRHYLPGEVEVVKSTGYGVSTMYINGVSSGDRVVLVDSIISTGGTYSAIISRLEAMGVVVQDAVAVIERTDYDGVERVRRETGVEVKTLIKVAVENGKLIFTE